MPRHWNFKLLKQTKLRIMFPHLILAQWLVLIWLTPLKSSLMGLLMNTKAQLVAQGLRKHTGNDHEEITTRWLEAEHFSINVNVASNKLLMLMRGLTNFLKHFLVLTFIGAPMTITCSYVLLSLQSTSLLLYLDDDIITSNDSLGISYHQRYFMQTFHINDHRHLHLTNILGLEITKLYKGISIHLQKYAEDLKFMARLIKSRTFDITLELVGR